MGTYQLIYIRTDGNKEIASGHLTRCLSIALACRQLGMAVHFLVSDEESLALLSDICENLYGQGTPSLSLPVSEKEPSSLLPASAAEKPFSVSRLQTASYNHLEQELPELTALLSSQISREPSSFPHTFSGSGKTDTPVITAKPVILLDSFFVTEPYLSALKPLAKVAYLDDLCLFDYPVDLLINYDVIPDSELAAYHLSYQNAGQLLLGAAYTPLRSQFQGKQISVKNQVKNILITTGASDPRHFCLAFIDKLTSPDLSDAFGPSGVVFHMVIGKLNTDKTALYRLAGELPFVRLHENVADMASLMLNCDFAISAAGTTLYELCALGVPAVSFTMADNQVISAKAFAAAGAIPCAGDIRENQDEVLNAVFQLMKDYSSGNSYGKRKSAQTAMRRLVDGNGALRIARALKNQNFKNF